MVARRRLWQRFGERLALVGLAVLLTIALPALAHYRRADLPALTRLGAAGPYTLRLAPLALVGLVAWDLLQLRRRERRLQRRLEEEGVTYRILPLADAPPVSADRVTLWQRLAETLPRGEHLAWEVGGGRDGIAFSLRAASDQAAREALAKVRAEWLGTELRRVAAPANDPLWQAAPHVRWVEVRPANREQPIIPKAASAMTGLLSDLARLPDGVSAGLQVVVREDPFTAHRLSRKAARLTSRRPETGPYALLPSAEERQATAALHARAQETFLEARVLLWAAADSPTVARGWAQALAQGIVAGFEDRGPLAGNPLRLGASGKGSLLARPFPVLSGHPWTAGELGSLAHLVGRDGRAIAQTLEVARYRTLAATPATWLPTEAVPPELAPLAQTAPAPADAPPPGRLQQGVTRLEGVWDAAAAWLFGPPPPVADDPVIVLEGWEDGTER